MQEVKDLINCKIDQDNNITVKLVKMGMDIDDTRNHRVRGVIPAANSDFLFVEILQANRPDRTQFHNREDLERYDRTYINPEYIYVDFCFRVNSPEEYFDNISPGYRSGSYPHLAHSKENIIKLLQKYNSNIKDIELVDKNYIDEFCDNKGFYKLYDDRLKHEFKPLEITHMNKSEIGLKMQYSCFNHDESIYYEEEKSITRKTEELEKIFDEYGNELMKELINKYEEKIKNLFSKKEESPHKKKDKLCYLVDILENNKDCVLLKVKEDARLDLIKLGCFTGNEELMRLTKGEDHTCTIINKDGTTFSWHWGKSGHTIVTDETSKKGKLIEECITEDFDIYIGENLVNVNNSLRIKSLDDVKDAIHSLEFMYWDKKKPKDIVVHKDSEFYKTFDTIPDAINHFENLNYKIEKLESFVAKTGCIVDDYYIEKIKEKDLEI